MKKGSKEKTNVMRMLDQKKIPYKSHCYKDTPAVSGLEVTRVLGEDPDRVFKTLVTSGKSGEHYVFIVPVNRELDLKKAAKVVGEKSLSMIHVKEIQQVTGYIRGGCTAVGMKKQYVTRIDASAEKLEKIVVSGGRIGTQLELKPEDLRKAAGAEYADVVVE